jgi:hypothetical protein
LRHVNDAGGQLCLNWCPLAEVVKEGKPCEAPVYLHHNDDTASRSVCAVRPFVTGRAGSVHDHDQRSGSGFGECH